MPTYYARKAGNINATDVWATTPSGTASNLFPTFTNADVLMANSFTITVNVSTTVAELRNDATGGATAGGTFNLSDSVTLTANLVQGQVTGGGTIVTYGGSFPNSASIVANASSVNTSGNANVIQFTGSGTLNFTGNLTGDASGAGTTNGTLLVSGSGVLNFTGNSTGGSGTSTLGSAGIHVSSSTPTININGNCFGGTGIAPGVRNAGAATVIINGIAAGAPTTGTGAGVLNASTGIVYLKRAKGNAYGPSNSSGIAPAVGAANSGLGVIEIQEIEYGTFGMSPTSGTGIRLKKANTNVAVFNYCDTAGAKTLIDATQNAAMPAATDVRSGVSYASGAATGSCAVPAAGSVALGVPVDNTTGTAILTPAALRAELATELARLDAPVSAAGNAPSAATVASAVWGAAARTITGGSVDTLINSPDVPTESEIAAAVWNKSTTELTVSGSIGERAKNQSTVSTTGAQLAAALS